MQLGFVMEADAAPHDDRPFWPDLVDRRRGRRLLRRHFVSLDVGDLFSVGQVLEMPPASVAPVAARLEKMRIPKILPSVITSRHSHPRPAAPDEQFKHPSLDRKVYQVRNLVS